MSKDGMHKKNAGERRGRSLAKHHTNEIKPMIGLRGIVKRAKLSNAVGYDAKEAPRITRGIVTDNKYGISFGNKYR
jgi:hypothetical protein